MKTIILLLAAILAMVGFAVAWETTEQMQYGYQKSVSTQTGQNLSWLSSAQSNAYFTSGTAYGSDQASVVNGQTTIFAPLQTAPGSSTVPDTHNSISQGGVAVVTTAAPDLENPDGVKFSGQAATSEVVSLSGLYAGDLAANGGVYALFNQKEGVGLSNANVLGTTNGGGDWPSTTNTVNNNKVTEPQYSAAIETGSGSFVVDAILGQTTTTGFQQLQAEGAVPTMNGSQSTYAGFGGAFTTNTNGITQVETQVAGSSAFQMTSQWSNSNPIFNV